MALFAIPGGPELWIILAIVLVLFGPSRLPKLGKSLGKTVKAIREGVDGKAEEEDAETGTEAAPKKKAAAVADDDEE